MTRAQEILLGVFTTPAQIADRLIVLARRMNFSQQACTQVLGQLARIPTVRLDPLARLDWNQRRRMSKNRSQIPKELSWG